MYFGDHLQKLLFSYKNACYLIAYNNADQKSVFSFIFTYNRKYRNFPATVMLLWKQRLRWFWSTLCWTIASRLVFFFIVFIYFKESFIFSSKLWIRFFSIIDIYSITSPIMGFMLTEFCSSKTGESSLFSRLFVCIFKFDGKFPFFSKNYSKDVPLYKFADYRTVYE